MRTRLPAALLLVLSWLLPTIGQAAGHGTGPGIGHSQVAPQVAAIRAAIDQAAAVQLGSTPPPPPLAQIRHGGHDQAGPGGPALSAAAPARLPQVWSAVVRRPGSRAAADRPQGAAAARAPPSTVL
ncbi:hypothetical protein [Nonomuraea sp. NPDC049607]|uniref:hypothetical protein n=1 Tax=Nonomuraea sp. NPDC049607 TaxID=3154732 RepID=UPI00343DFCE2